VTISINPDPMVWLLLPLGALAFALLVSAISIFGGWYNLSKRYPLPLQPGTVLKVYKWRSMNINYITAYGSLVKVTITNLGLVLELPLFRYLLHKPLFFSWNDIGSLRFERGLLGKVVFKMGRSRIAIYGSPAKGIYSVYAAKKK
jgi:hypothetical protein